MCDTIAAVGDATASGIVLFGKNSDREYDEAQHLELIAARRYKEGARVRLTYTEIRQARETYAVVLSKPHWIWGAEAGANEYGLTIGNEAVFSKISPSFEPGIIGMDYLRLALERARSVDEGISVITGLLREHGQSGRCGFRRELAYHNSFILADHEGAKVLETVDREWVVARIQDYYAISNIMTIDESFEASSSTVRTRAVDAGLYETGAPFGFKTVYEDAPAVASGRFRRARAMELLKERVGKLGETDFFRILRDHQEGDRPPDRPSGPRICAHTRESPLGQTTGSWVTTLGPGKTLHWVTGTSAPCSSLFKPVFIEFGLPEHGSLPGAEEDGRSLWWRHESLRRALDACGEETRRAFIAEREMLETQFIKEVGACPPQTSPENRAIGRGIVEECWRNALGFEQRWLTQLVR